MAALGAALAGSAVLGVAAGLIWAAVAPRALLQEVGHGEAQLVNAESSAFILADAWFCLIAAVGGVITGIAGYRLLVRRAGWSAARWRLRCSCSGPARTSGSEPTTTCSPPARTAPSSTRPWPWGPRA